MSIETALYTQLSGYANLTALISTRIYPVKFPQGYTKPAIVYLVVSGTPVNSVDGSGAKENNRIQIDCVATTYAGVKAVVTQVKAAMAAATTYKSLLLLQQDIDFEPDTELYRVSLDFSTWL